MRHASPRTIETYCRWVRRFVAFSGRRDPRALGPREVTRFLSSLATEDKVAASTQNQALAALLFLYKEVLGQPLEFLDQLVYANGIAGAKVGNVALKLFGVDGIDDSHLRILWCAV